MGDGQIRPSPDFKLLTRMTQVADENQLDLGED
eukprot:CAMPEP_0184289878 /NCGR_PEP_ID=MMETSP1049-20130417/2254_1 /TAXON_ID=77928 /ORGANISM="Proteomonas sulcata, Strain CCMP704" /LENGTH=32 /DNA_ID= /DNA_START= /DNA_END= /DNA_ORIENTATION=